jgi:hypothetical protein
MRILHRFHQHIFDFLRFRAFVVQKEAGQHPLALLRPALIDQALGEVQNARDFIAMLECCVELIEDFCSDHHPVAHNLAESIQFCLPRIEPSCVVPRNVGAIHENPREEERHRKAVKLFGIMEVAVELLRRKIMKVPIDLRYSTQQWPEPAAIIRGGYSPRREVPMDC